MEPYPALTNYDILFEIVQQFALVRRPYDVKFTRSNAYWGPPHPVIDDNIFNWERVYTHPMKEERKTLASLSLTCRAFSELALDELCAAPCGGLYTLLHLFSAFTHREASYASWTLDGTRYHLHEYYFDGNLSHDDWVVFRRCAARVRELAYYTYWDLRIPYHIEGSVFAQLFELSGGQPLFPNLRVLSWQRSSLDEDLSKLARIIAPPTLSVLNLHHPMWMDYKPRFVPAYFTMDGRPEDLQLFTDGCPLLEHIFIDLVFPSNDLYSIANFRHLRSFSAERVQLDVLWRLSQLPNLTYIDAELHSEEPSDRPATSPVEVPLAPFSSLKRIAFTKSLPSPVVSFLEGISPIGLTSATIRLMRARSDDIPLCLRALCSERLAHTLRLISVSFECTDEERGRESERCHFLALARPLLRATCVEVLHFSVYARALVLSDDDVAEMGRSWPHIVSLSIDHDPEYIDPKNRPRGPGAHYANLVRPSLSALVSLAERCGNLESVKFDPADVSEAELASLEARAASAIPRSPPLSQFVPARSDAFDELVIHDVPRLASALHRIFPNLEGKGTLARHERRPIRARLADWDTGLNNRAEELLRRLDAMRAEEKRGVRSAAS